MAEVTISVAASGDDGFTAVEGATADPWPPKAGGGGTEYVVTNSTSDFGLLVRKLHTSFQECAVGLMRFDTSVIPDGATITGAILRVYCTAKGSDGRDLAIGYYDGDANWPIDASDYTESDTPTSDAALVPIADLTVGASKDIALSNLGSIDKTGYTGFRWVVDGGDPGATDYRIHLAEYDHATSPEPQLIVTYTPPTQTLSLGHRDGAATLRGSSVEATGAATLSAGRKTTGVVARGTTVTPSGSATIGVGRRAGAAVTRGASPLGSGSTTLGVGRRAGASTLYGVSVTSSLILSVGRKASGAVARGSSPTATGVASFGAAGKGSAAVIRGTSVTPSGSAALLLGRLVGSPTLRGITVDDVPLLTIVSLALAATLRRNLSLGATSTTLTLEASQRHELNLEAEIQ